jgi:hypothetical protein
LKAAIIKEGKKLGGAEANLFVCENLSARRTQYEAISKISFSQKHFGTSDAKKSYIFTVKYRRRGKPELYKVVQGPVHRLRKTLCFKSALTHLILVFRATMQFCCFVWVYQSVIKPR